MTKSNLDLMTTLDDDLTVIEKQRKFILRRYVVMAPCPNCGEEQNIMQALDLAFDEYDATANHLYDCYQCIECERELVFTLPLIDPWAWHWSLAPVETKRMGKTV